MLLFLFLHNERLYYWGIIKITQTNNGPDLVEVSPGRQGLTIKHSPLCCNWQAGPANVAANKSHSEIPCSAQTPASIIYNIYMCINTFRNMLTWLANKKIKCTLFEKDMWCIKLPLRIILWCTEWFWSVIPSDWCFKTLPCVSTASEAAAAYSEIKPSSQVSHPRGSASMFIPRGIFIAFLLAS